MTPQLLFLLGPQRSGSTLLERILSAHSLIHGGPEPHLLTPLAHSGFWANVDKAPYDHILAAVGQKDFVRSLSGGEDSYYAACRAYCDVLYSKYLEGTGKPICLDKTPEYVTIVPFITRIYPDAKYVVLTRHPLAILSSFANSFFDGDYALALRHDAIVGRSVAPLAHLLRERNVSLLHVTYEDLVQDPERCLIRVCDYLGVPFEAHTIDYAHHGHKAGLGDPTGVRRHSRPSTDSLFKWADELAVDPKKRALAERVIDELAPADLETLGYPLDSLWQPLQVRSAHRATSPTKIRLTRYLLERKAIIGGRARVQRSPALRRAVEKVRLACDVLLREY